MDSIGWGKQQIRLAPNGYAMQGYGMWKNRALGQRSALYARAVFIGDDGGAGMYFCCLDTGYVTHAMREGVCAAMRSALGEEFDEAAFVLTCTHTHSGPGGCTHDALYNIVTPGFVAENLDGVVTACVAALLAARRAAAPAEMRFASGSFADDVPVAWNRSLQAYNQNPDVAWRSSAEAHLALDRRMDVIGFYRGGKLCALISFFGVHATCVGNSLANYDGDNKGYAAAYAEAGLAAAGSEDAVAIFAQATAGDVSPHYHGPGQGARRRRIKGDAEYAYARRNGELQGARALEILGQGGAPLAGGMDAVFSWADFSRQHADPEYAGGCTEAVTGDPCHGVAFFSGTPVDGPGMPRLLAFLAGFIADVQKRRRLSLAAADDTPESRYYVRLYAAQGNKRILLEDVRKRVLGRPIGKLPLPGFVDPLVAQMKQQAGCGALEKSALVPTVLPLQIVRLGPLALVCCPGEFTTVAGRRLVESVQKELLAAGVMRTLICTYCNDYMGYVTTREEYQVQAYEGGHTIFGQWTLAAFQTRFAALARQLCKPAALRDHDRKLRPAPCPPEELALRSDLAVPRWAAARSA